MGATANDIMEQIYRNNEQRSGAYVSRPHLTAEQNRRAAQQFQLQQAQRQPGYGNPSAENGFDRMAPQMKLEREMVGLLKDVQYLNTITSEKEYYASPHFKNDFSNYVRAKEHITEMLEGKRPLSVKDAFFMAEAAYGNLHLTRREYDNIISDNAHFIRQWLRENGYGLDNPEALHYGIQKFMSDTLYITVNGKPQGHVPYYYDYIDPRAKDDKRNYFVTKTLATGSGQCHTFPVLYLILSEQLGAEVGMAYNPQHSFIRYRNNRGTIVNYETTVDKFLPNAFYIETLPVMATSQRNNLHVNYHDTKQVVASVLFELAKNFVEEHWLGDRSFVRECMTIATPHFPEREYISLAFSGLKRILLADAFNTKVIEKGITDLRDVERYPDVLRAYRDYHSYMEQVSRLGIQDFPEDEYLKLLEYYDEKGRLQTARKLNAKTRKSLFLN